jgi:crotonobetaine/carnitine-CoA ligase
MYTSGTTGPSKGVMVPYHLAYQYSNPNASHFQVDGDVIYVTLPLFHIGGQWQGVYAALLCEGRAVLKRKFSVSNFWADVDAYGATQTTLLGVMAEFLWKQPPSDEDRQHSLRRATMAPALRQAAEFGERFGLRLGQGWGLTETGAVTRPPALDEPAQDPQCCGRVRDDLYEMILVDDDDQPVPPGTAGQALVRPKEPYALMLGYWRKPEATVAAWQNLWFHTGDALVENPDGTFSFVDRQKDCIRRRGENISSLEVERGVSAHPDIAECAAVPVQTEYIEDEVMVIVSRKPGAAVEPTELHSWLLERMPTFMVPRYIEVVDELPKTPTSKIKKDVLRATGVGPSTWDAMSAGGDR